MDEGYTLQEEKRGLTIVNTCWILPMFYMCAQIGMYLYLFLATVWLSAISSVGIIQEWKSRSWVLPNSSLANRKWLCFFPGHIDSWLRLKPDLDNAILLEELTSAQPHIFNSCITILDVTSLQNLRLVFENFALALSYKMPCRGI